MRNKRSKSSLLASLAILAAAGAAWYFFDRRKKTVQYPVDQLPNFELPDIALPGLLQPVQSADIAELSPYIARIPVTTSAPRGIRNNNPGNIRKSSTAWQGKVTVSSDPAFEQFSSAHYGLRALARNILTYQQNGLRTLRAIILRWAPPVENNSAAYISDVSLRTGIAPDDFLDLAARPELLAKIVAAIVWHENGEQPYSQAEINAAVAAAGR